MIALEYYKLLKIGFSFGTTLARPKGGSCLLGGALRASDAEHADEFRSEFNY